MNFILNNENVEVTNEFKYLRMKFSSPGRKVKLLYTNFNAFTLECLRNLDSFLPFVAGSCTNTIF